MHGRPRLKLYRPHYWFSFISPQQMFCRRALKSFLSSNLQWYLITLQMSSQRYTSYVTVNSFVSARSHSRLMIAVSYNLWSSADHRCWHVGWGVFLIKRQMSGGGIFTVWHDKSWHHFKGLSLLCCPKCLRDIIGANGNAPLANSQWWGRLSQPPRPTCVLRRLHSVLKKGDEKACLSFREIQCNDWYFSIMTVASKNKRTTVSPATRAHYVPLWGAA